MAGTAYRYGGAGPRQVRLNTGDTFTWLSDGSVTYEGFTICAASTLAAPPPPAQKCTRRIAMSIVLDRSGSMNGHTNDGRVFASSLISQLLLSPSHSRASVTTFARDASTYTTMEAGTSEAAVLEAIGAVWHRGGARCGHHKHWRCSIGGRGPIADRSI